jgi:lactate dehydrogenase-like 2-hydroxyacid dehydrogenase
MAAKIFVTRELPPKPMEALRHLPDVELRVNPHDRVLTREELLDGVRWCDLLLCQLTDRIDAEVFEANSNMRLVANYAVGFNNIVVAEATQRKIPVSNTPGVLTDSTADLTWALLMAVARRVVESDKYMRAGKYKSWAPMLFLGTDVHHKTLGIIGLGRIGYAMAKRAQGFDMNVLYADIEEKPYAAEVNAKFVDMDTLLRESDFVTLHPFLDEKSTHLIDEAQLRMMKPTAYLLNVSRGPVVNEKTLVKALQQGWIAGAGLDVYEREPDMEPELATMDNVVIVPHIASATHETRTAMGMIVYENTAAVLKGEKPPTCVNPEIYDG